MDIKPIKKLLLPVGSVERSGKKPPQKDTRETGTMTDPLPIEDKEQEDVELHPQLQELLQYLADDEHVSVIKTDTLLEWKTRLDSLEQAINNLNSHMQNNYQRPPSPIVQAPQAPPSPNPPSPPSGLSALLHKYSKETDNGIALYNSYVDHTYVLNYAGSADSAIQQLQNLGFSNCVSVKSLKTQAGSVSELLIQALELAITNGDYVAAIVVDIAHIHSQFSHYFELAYSALTNDTWSIMQLSDTAYTNVIPTPTGLKPSTCPHTVAFCLKKEVLEIIKTHITKAPAGQAHLPSGLHQLCICPPLFAVGTSSTAEIPHYKRLLIQK